MTPSNATAPTKFLEIGVQRYAYRRFGDGLGHPLLFLQHFTGTLDNWDPAVTDPLARGREVILFENAGLGRSTGSVPTTIAGMAQHAFAFLDALKLTACDVLGFSRRYDRPANGAGSAHRVSQNASGGDGAHGWRRHHAP